MGKAPAWVPTWELLGSWPGPGLGGLTASFPPLAYGLAQLTWSIPVILEMASSGPGTSLWWFCRLQPLGYWASYLPYLCLSFLIYKMGTLLPL